MCFQYIFIGQTEITIIIIRTYVQTEALVNPALGMYEWSKYETYAQGEWACYYLCEGAVGKVDGNW